jgi:hypothetical protein
MTVGQYIIQANDMRSFAQDVLGPEDQKFLRQEARRVDASGREKQMREEQAQHDQQSVDEKRKMDAEKKEKKDAREAEIDAVTPLLDMAELIEIYSTWTCEVPESNLFMCIWPTAENLKSRDVTTAWKVTDCWVDCTTSCLKPP